LINCNQGLLKIFNTEQLPSQKSRFGKTMKQEEKANKKITALFCGGYVLKDGTVVIEEPTDLDRDLQEDVDSQESNGEKEPDESS
jgi:hypothetical protein